MEKTIYHLVVNLKNKTITQKEFDQGKAFLRDIVMHGAVGTALGGVCTIVGEPQNLLIATKADWSFMEFFLRMAPVTIPVLFFGILKNCFIEWIVASLYLLGLIERCLEINNLPVGSKAIESVKVPPLSIQKLHFDINLPLIKF